MIKNFQTYINEGLFDRNQSEFSIRKTDKGIEQVYIPKTKEELYEYIELDIEQAKKDGTYPNVNLNNIDVSEVKKLEDAFEYLFTDEYLFGGSKDTFDIVPDISNWNIDKLPKHFFEDNENIREFVIPDGIISIDECAFFRCKNLTSITIPNSVKRIGNRAFYYCNGLTSITIPDSVKVIEWSAFEGCRGLTSIVIPDSVANIGRYTFAECSKLELISLPKECDMGFSPTGEDCKIIRR